MRRLILGALAAAVALATAASADTGADAAATEAPAYAVVQTDASIPFGAQRVRSFRVGEDGSLLLQAGRRWYRAELWPPCDRDLPFEPQIALIDRNFGGRFDRFSKVAVDGNVCPLRRLDEIADPDAAPAAEIEGGGA